METYGTSETQKQGPCLKDERAVSQSSASSQRHHEDEVAVSLPGRTRTDYNSDAYFLIIHSFQVCRLHFEQENSMTNPQSAKAIMSFQGHEELGPHLADKRMNNNVHVPCCCSVRAPIRMQDPSSTVPGPLHPPVPLKHSSIVLISGLFPSGIVLTPYFVSLNLAIKSICCLSFSF